MCMYIGPALLLLLVFHCVLFCVALRAQYLCPIFSVIVFTRYCWRMSQKDVGVNTNYSVSVTAAQSNEKGVRDARHLKACFISSA